MRSATKMSEKGTTRCLPVSAQRTTTVFWSASYSVRAEGCSTGSTKERERWPDRAA